MAFPLESIDIVIQHREEQGQTAASDSIAWSISRVSRAGNVLEKLEYLISLQALTSLALDTEVRYGSVAVRAFQAR